MPDRPWKQAERRAAALLGGRRYPANQGGAVDVESAGVVAQVKEVRVCSLAQLGRLALEAERQGQQRGKIGLVIVKHRAGRGIATPTLVVLTAGQYREMSGPRPGEVTP